MRNTMEAKNSGRGEPVESMCWSQVHESDQLSLPSTHHSFVVSGRCVEPDAPACGKLLETECDTHTHTCARNHITNIKHISWCKQVLKAQNYKLCRAVPPLMWKRSFLVFHLYYNIFLNLLPTTTRHFGQMRLFCPYQQSKKTHTNGYKRHMQCHTQQTPIRDPSPPASHIGQPPEAGDEATRGLGEHFASRVLEACPLVTILKKRLSFFRVRQRSIHVSEPKNK